jgi:hypothetical protein
MEAERFALLEAFEPPRLERGIVGFVEVVDPDDLVASVEQLGRRVGADEPGSAGDEVSSYR